MVKRSLGVGVFCAVISVFGCGGKAPPAAPAAPPTPTAAAIFEMVAPSIVAILNDDEADREAERKEIEASMGDEHHRAPKRVIDVSSKRATPPHGTGFMVEGGQIVTAAHVVQRPDRLKVTTRAGETVEAELVRLDDVRDVAVLKPKTPLKNVPPLRLETVDIQVGKPVWALGHTGSGAWALSWGMSAGIASGVIDMFGAKLVLFDAAVYPGFSGGPVVDLDAQGKPRVLGVNHAILFTGGGLFPVASISSATYAPDVREVIAGRPPAVQPILADYAKKHRARVYADLFITDRLNVGRSPSGEQVASIFGNAHTIPAKSDGVRIPVVAMLFGLPKGSNSVEFTATDPNNTVVATWPATVNVDGKQRVAFASAHLRFVPKVHGKYHVVANKDGKEIGRSVVNLDLEEDDEELAEDGDEDAVDDGDPDVDIVVAQGGNDDPLMMRGIRASWYERSFPRRVGFTWIARGTRGWSGRQVSITAYVLDDAGNIVGRSDGCFQRELRPTHSWSCMGVASPPLATREGSYDIVFAINDKPVAWWPMEAAIRRDHAPGSAVDRWMQELKRHSAKKPKGGAAPPTPPAPPPAPPKPPATPPKPPAAPPKPPAKP
jgi:S1-C subfamily serine protease